MTIDNDILPVLKRAARLVRVLRRGGRSAAAALAAVQLVLGPALPAAAQRRSAEPEANPQFQQELQSPQSGGGGSAIESSAPAAAAEPEPAEASGAPEIQVGAARPERSAAAASVAPLDTRVTVRVHGAPLVTFLDTISSQSKINFIVTEGLESRRVTAILPNVTVREALQVLLEMKGLTYQQVGKSNTYIVTTRSVKAENLITRIYTLSYIPLIALGSAASEQAAISPMNASSLGGGAPAGLGGAGGSAASGGSEVAIVGVLKSILSRPSQGSPGGQVALEPRTNSLIVTDIPEVFPQVEQIIAELDKKAPQVMIEAQIVEIDSSRAKDLGIEWGGTNGELAAFVGGKRQTSFPMVLESPLSKTRFLDPVSGTLGGSGSGTGSNITQMSVLDLTALSVVLRALVTRSEARFLGKPKILALNNKPAIIKVDSLQATSIQNQQSSAGGAIATQTQSAERFDTGLILKVTPQINKDGYITMLVQPSYTDVQASAVSTAIFDPVTRAASTLVRVKNGQTLVIAGLLQSTESKTVRKVPFLGYIPLIGWLFTSTTSSNKNSDLVIFITPTIVND